jgi:hypothetical protein
MYESSALALEYFRIGNAVTAFFVVQTLLFLNYIYREKLLLVTLYEQNCVSQIANAMFCVIYVIVVFGCFGLERQLGKSDPAMIRASCWAAMARIFVIVSLSTFNALIIYLIGRKPLRHVYLPDGRRYTSTRDSESVCRLAVRKLSYIFGPHSADKDSIPLRRPPLNRCRRSNRKNGG